MAGGKQDTRQKMINMMYLVFIAMLALNISKEVLATLGMINYNIDQATQDLFEDSEKKYKKFSDNETIPFYRIAALRAPKIKLVADEYYSYIESLKTALLSSDSEQLNYVRERVNKKTKKKDSIVDYQIMDKSEKLDSIFFEGNLYTADGEEYIKKYTSFQAEIRQQLDSIYFDDIKRAEGNPDLTPAGFSFTNIENLMSERFAYSDSIVNRDGKYLPYLDYHFKSFPLIASLSKFTKVQSDIRYVENKILESLLNTIGKNEVGLDTYQTLLETTKPTYFTGQVVDASIVMGKKDSDFRPDREELKINGRLLTRGREYDVDKGVVKLKYVPKNAGNLNLTGKLFFNRDGEELSVDVAQQISITNPPRDAIISVDKLRAFYVGLENYLSVSIPGATDNSLVVSCPSSHGSIKRKGNKWLAVPNKTMVNKKFVINVSGIINGQRTSMPPQKFDVKPLPLAIGSIKIAGVDGSISSGKLPTSLIKNGIITAAFPKDFFYTVDVMISGFSIQVGNSPSINISSNMISDSNAVPVLENARRGDLVYISNIKANITSDGKKLPIPNVSPLVLTIN
jgi:gliding motility-associated protein GldM